MARILSFGIDQTFVQQRAQLLAKAGLAVSSASQKDEALRLARLAPPDVVIFGHRVPRPLRASLARAMKTINPAVRIIFIYLASCDDSEMADAALSLGSEPDMLVSTVRDLLARGAGTASA